MRTETLFSERRVHRHQPLVQAQANWWESGFKLDIPEFSGGLQPEEFLDWIAAVEEVLDFKGVPEDRRVSLVATKFRGKATVWWQQLKQSRTRLGKSKINRWEKLLKHMWISLLAIQLHPNHVSAATEFKPRFEYRG
jgi:hypothetical protein